MNLLYEAIKKQDINSIENMLNKCKSSGLNMFFSEMNELYNYIGAGGKDILQKAFDSKNEEIIKLIINFKVENYYNKFNKIALIRAINSASVDILKCVLSCDIDINQVNGKGENALMLAIKLNKKEAIELLLKSKIDINHRDNNGSNALFFAFENKNKFELIEKLNKHKINFSEIGNGKESEVKEVNLFLLAAYQENGLSILKKIIEENNKADNKISLSSLNNNGANALMLSTYYAHCDKQETFKFIYDNLTEINKYQKDYMGNGLIKYIIDQKINTNSLHTPMLKYLIENQYFMYSEFDVQEWNNLKHLVVDSNLVEKIDNQINVFQEKEKLNQQLSLSNSSKKSLKL